MTLGKVPGALALGLLASLVAHAGLYGGGHAMGGDYHALLTQLAIAGAASLLFFYVFLVWDGAGSAVNGSVLAARLTSRLPGFGLVLASATVWYAVAELVEARHPAGIPWIAVPIGLAVAAWLFRAISRIALAVLAGAIVAVFRAGFAPRTPSWTRFTPYSRPLRPVLWARRRFARPPPIGFDCCA